MNEEEEFIPPTDEQVKEFLDDAYKIDWPSLFLGYDKQLKSTRKRYGDTSMEFQVLEKDFRDWRKAFQDAFLFSLVDFYTVNENDIGKIKRLFDEDERTTCFSLAPFFKSRKKRHLIGDAKPIILDILSRPENTKRKS